MGFAVYPCGRLLSATVYIRVTDNLCRLSVLHKTYILLLI